MYRIVLPVDGDDIVGVSWADSHRVARLNALIAMCQGKNGIIRETMKNINYILFVSSTPNAEIYIQFRQLKP